MEYQKVCYIIGITLLGATSFAALILVEKCFEEIKRLKKEVSRLRKLFANVCKNWSIDAEDVQKEILEMVADHEAEKAEIEAENKNLKQEVKNLKHANKQLAKGEKSK